MKNLLKKELKLAASPLTWLFLVAAFMTMIPGYPILVGAFFVCFGIFQSFQNGRESNDTLYTVLLPVKKSDVVSAKYVFACFFQMIAFVVMAALTAVRMTVLSDSVVYKNNVLMSATPVFLAFVLLVFATFNLLFIGGFFKTAYAIGKPFVFFIIAAFLIVGVSETLHHIPGLEFLHTPCGERMKIQWFLFGAALVIYVTVTLVSCHHSKQKFERIDL